MAQLQMYPMMAGSLQTTVTSAISQTDVQLNVANISAFPDIGIAGGNLVTIWTQKEIWETCQYTAKVATSNGAGYLTIVRSGADHDSSSSGAALSWTTGAKCARNITKRDFDILDANIVEHETRITANTTAISSINSTISARQITAGLGLSGGGSLSSDVPLAVDFTEFPIVSTPTDDDYIPISRPSGHSRIKKSDLFADAEIFGFAWNTKSSSPTLTRIDENGDTINPFPSKFNNHPLWGQIKRCQLTAAGAVTYGTNNAGAGLDTTKDFMMVEFPQTHVMHWVDGDYLCFCLNDKAFSSKPAGTTLSSVIQPWFYQRGNTTPVSKGYVGAYKASANGTTSLSSKSGVAPLVNIDMTTFESRGNAIGSWGISNFWFQSLLQLLMYTEFGTLNIQAALGPGFTNANNTGPRTCGADDSLMNTSGSTQGTTDVQDVCYRGLNSPYGNIWEFRIGYNSLDDRYRVLNRLGIGTTATIPATLTTTGTEDTAGVTPIRSTNAYISSILNVDPLKLAFIPAALGGSESTYLCDYFYSHVAGQVGCLLAGGHWADAGTAGPGCLASHGAVSVVGPSVGARLEFLKA